MLSSPTGPRADVVGGGILTGEMDSAGAIFVAKQCDRGVFMNKTFVCLANSRKNSGKCIAGKIQSDQSWFRPVSERPSEEISEIEMRYKDGTMPIVLDVIRIATKGPKPNKFQTENHLIDTGYYWEKVGTFEAKDMNSLCDDPRKMWSGLNSSYQGLNDRIPSAGTQTVTTSLLLLKPDSGKVIVREEGGEFGNAKRKVRVEFCRNGRTFRLPVTHPEIERSYLGQQDGDYVFQPESYIVVSMGLPHSDGNCYLFAAALYL